MIMNTTLQDVVMVLEMKMVMVLEIIMVMVTQINEIFW